MRLINNPFYEEGRESTMTDNINTHEELAPVIPAGMISNPQAKPATQTVQYGSHELEICDGGEVIVNGDHVCFDQVSEEVD